MSGPTGVAGALESAFAAPEAAAAPFGLRRAAAEIHPASVRLVVHERLRGAWRAVSGLADSQAASVQVLPVELLDGGCDRRRIVELDERESAGFVGGTVDRKKDLFDRARFREQCLKVRLRRFVTQIPDEDSRRNGKPPFVVTGPRLPQPARRLDFVAGRETHAGQRCGSRAARGHKTPCWLSIL